jgi:hypothetical protein
VIPRRRRRRRRRPRTNPKPSLLLNLLFLFFSTSSPFLIEQEINWKPDQSSSRYYFPPSPPHLSVEESERRISTSFDFQIAMKILFFFFLSFDFQIAMRISSSFDFQNVRNNR